MTTAHTHWILASNNAGKVSELQNLLADANIQITPQAKLGISEIEETGLSFIENALIKARHASRQNGQPALADDSGLAVAALGGAPGIYSARYAGPHAQDSTNIDKLLHDLKEVPFEQRQARFYCVLAFVQHADDPTPVICQGTWDGMIALKRQGENGFGYDPIFWLPELQCSAAQLPPEQKKRLSHRAKAMQQLLEWVQQR